MSVSFTGIKKRGMKYPRSLDLNNGLAGRILQAMGLPPCEETAGKMPLKEAIAGVEKAKGTLAADDLQYLDELSAICQDLKKARRTELTWG
jgi:hypothetical protein